MTSKTLKSDQYWKNWGYIFSVTYCVKMLIKVSQIVTVFCNVHELSSVVMPRLYIKFNKSYMSWQPLKTVIFASVIFQCNLLQEDVVQSKPILAVFCNVHELSSIVMLRLYIKYNKIYMSWQPLKMVIFCNFVSIIVLHCDIIIVWHHDCT